MNNTMLQFKETASKINILREQEKKQEEMIIDNFTKSTCELAECFYWILKSELRGIKCCCLSIDTCPELCARKLSNMGFEVTEMKNGYDQVIVYDIMWD